MGRLFVVASGMMAALMLCIAQPAIATPIVPNIITTQGLYPALVARLTSIPIEQLPPEAIQTIRTIEQGGKFPYRQDGSIFSNRERRLPIAPHRTYHEYTVPTPGLRHRGARRIITAPDRIYYYTGDHYRTFQQVSNK